MKKRFDLCAKTISRNVPKEMIISLLSLFGIPRKCSFTKKTTFCYDGKLVTTILKSQIKLMRMFEMTSDSKVRINITHDTGNSCFEGSNKIVKRN